MGNSIKYYLPRIFKIVQFEFILRSFSFFLSLVPFYVVSDYSVSILVAVIASFFFWRNILVFGSPSYELRLLNKNFNFEYILRFSLVSRFIIFLFFTLFFFITEFYLQNINDDTRILFVIIAAFLSSTVNVIIVLLQYSKNKIRSIKFIYFLYILLFLCIIIYPNFIVEEIIFFNLVILIYFIFAYRCKVYIFRKNKIEQQKTLIKGYIKTSFWASVLRILQHNRIYFVLLYYNFLSESDLYQITLLSISYMIGSAFSVILQKIFFHNKIIQNLSVFILHSLLLIVLLSLSLTSFETFLTFNFLIVCFFLTSTLSVYISTLYIKQNLLLIYLVFSSIFYFISNISLIFVLNFKGIYQSFALCIMIELLGMFILHCYFFKRQKYKNINIYNYDD